jgi:lambda family phage minor tail protein L
MADKPIVEDLQKLEITDAIVHLFELEVTKGNFFYFTNQIENDLSSVKMRDYDSNGTIRTYVPMPVQADGFESKNDGAIPRPTIVMANVTNTLSNAVGNFDYQTLLGLKVVRRTTLAKYLDDGTGNSVTPPVEFPRQVFYVDRIKTRTRFSIELELVSPFDLENVKIPARVVHANRCSFKYQGASRHLPAYKRAQSGCVWDVESKPAGSANHVAYVNMDDEYVIDSGVTFTTYSSGAINKNTYYKTTQVLARSNPDGTSSSVTVNNYWQATTSSSNPGTPNDTNVNFNRIRIYSDYNNSLDYHVYSDDRHNSYVRFTNATSGHENNGKVELWKAVKPSKDETPSDTNDFWEKGDSCSKTTIGCKMRFAASKISGDNSTNSTSINNNKTYPFGGFPAARRFN